MEIESQEAANIKASFNALKIWMEDSLDMFRDELLRVLYPLFLHVYLDLVANRKTEIAIDFFSTFKQDFLEKFPNKKTELSIVESVTDTLHLRDNTFVTNFRSHKYRLHIGPYAFALFKSYIEERNLINYMRIVCHYFDVESSNTFKEGLIDGIYGVEHLDDAIVDLTTCLVNKDTEDAVLNDEKFKYDPVEQFVAQLRKSRDKDAKRTGSSVSSSYILAEIEKLKDLCARVNVSAAALPSVCCYTVHNTNEGLCCAEISEDTAMIALGYEDSYIEIHSLRGPLKKLKTSADLGKAEEKRGPKREYNKTKAKDGIELINSQVPYYDFSKDEFTERQGPGAIIKDDFAIAPGGREVTKEKNLGFNTVPIDAISRDIETSFGKGQGLKTVGFVNGPEGRVATCGQPLGPPTSMGDPNNFIKEDWNCDSLARNISHATEGFKTIESSQNMNHSSEMQKISTLDSAYFNQRATDTFTEKTPIDYNLEQIYGKPAEKKDKKDTSSHLYTEIGTSAKLIGHTGPVYAMKFFKGNKYLLSCSKDTTIRLWSLELFSCLAVYKSHVFPVWCVDVHPENLYFASGSSDKQALLWSVLGTRPERLFISALSDVTVVKFHPNGNYLFTGSNDNKIRMHGLDGSLLRVYNGHLDGITCLEISHDGKLMLSGSKDQNVILWDISTSKIIHKYVGHEKTIYTVAFCFFGNLMASTSADNTLRLYDRAEDKDKACAVYYTKNTPLIHARFGYRNIMSVVGPYNG